MEEEKEKKPEVVQKVVDGKTYNVYMPSDPAEENMCDGCQ